MAGKEGMTECWNILGFMAGFMVQVVTGVKS